MSDLLYALSIKQPWAEYILSGDKDIEYRRWDTGIRGTVYIHVSKVPDEDEMSKFISDGIELQLGGIVGKVDIVDVEKYGVNDYGFKLENAKRIDFIPCNGQLYFWVCNGVLKNAR